MKIVWTDGLDRETISERVVAENISDKREANIMLLALRMTSANDESQWYKLVPDDSVLRKFKP